jgi:hypothetical protein
VSVFLYGTRGQTAELELAAAGRNNFEKGQVSRCAYMGLSPSLLLLFFLFIPFHKLHIPQQLLSF